ncbi:hypothetical protein [Rufibacter ruber]|uniref:hypothetical protein n=1 Tax=Rufibacter ruber TaxID=1783499 RepID=UPI00082F2F16|nr:hypothetical protein [Rufibacter ruber]
MKINRDGLIQDLFAFTQAGSGVVIGRPGVGKSHSLSQMSDSCISNAIPSIIISVDQMIDGSDLEIQTVVGVEGDWITYLESLTPPAGTKGVLIFDAYDAAREEELRKKFLSLITKAKERLKNSWNVIVSVRTFDAAKSPRLISLFPKTQVYQDPINCRNFQVPVLSDADLSLYFQAEPVIGKLFYESDLKLQEVLRIPFFLELFETIVKGNEHDHLFLKGLKSEIELLELFWRQKISNTEESFQREHLLEGIAIRMVTSRTLAVSKFEGSHIQDISTFNLLLSDNILSECGISSNKISFSHNILFDFAVSKLAIPESPSELSAFISEEQSRPYFLRPSFIYFFSRLWHYEPQRFWAILEELMKATDRQILLFAKLIPSTVIAQEFDDASQILTPIQTSGQRENLIQNILQAIRFKKPPQPEKYLIDFLTEISKNLSMLLLWDFAILLEQAIHVGPAKISSEYWDKCGVAARNLLKFILLHRDGEQKNNLDLLGSTRSIDLVARTYRTNKVGSRTLLDTILGFLQTPDFEIRYISSLCENLKHFLEDDPEFVAKVYRSVYAYQETSQEETIMFPSVITQFKSNRRQDFDMCHYRLEQHFNSFLASNPDLGVSLGVEITNEFVFGKERLQDVLSSIPLAENTMEIGDILATYIPDMSSVWASGHNDDSASKILRRVFDYFQNLILAQDFKRLESLLRIYLSHAQVAYTWKKLLEFASNYPQAMYEIMFPLLTNQKILLNIDTMYEAGLFLGKSAGLYSSEQLHAIENAILDLSSNSEEGNEATSRRFLNLIPRENLLEDRSRELLDKGSVPHNAPPFEITSYSSAYTEEMWLSDNGVNLQHPANRQVLDSQNELESFNRSFLNNVPSREAYMEPLQTALQLFDTVTTTIPGHGLSDEVIDSALNKIAETCSIVCRHVSSLEQEEFVRVKAILLFCLGTYTENDRYAEENYSPSSVYSTTPRMSAAEGLFFLLKKETQEEILPLIHGLSADKNAVIRFRVIKNLGLLLPDLEETFWSILKDRLAKEKDWFTAGILVSHLNYMDFSLAEERIVECLEIAFQNVATSTGKNSFLDNFYLLLLWFTATTGNAQATAMVESSILNPLAARELVFATFKILNPSLKDYSDQTQVRLYERVLQVIQNIIAQSADRLKQIDMTSDEEARETFSILDNIVQRIFFSLQVEDEPKSSNRRNRTFLPEDERLRFYWFVKPVLTQILAVSREIHGGLVLAHTAHYFIEIMGSVLYADTEYALDTTSQVTRMSVATGYTFDRQSILEAVKLTEALLADHKDLLSKPEPFGQLLDLLNIYVESGWPEALDLLWRLDDVFR